VPLYMVIPSFDGGVADGDATKAALQIQGKHKVRYRGYWVEVGGGKVLCLVESTSAAAPEAVHCQAVHCQAVHCEGGPSL
jgi:hypothetical protein